MTVGRQRIVMAVARDEHVDDTRPYLTVVVLEDGAMWLRYEISQWDVTTLRMNVRRRGPWRRVRKNWADRSPV
jgi:hypothetical protein